MGPPALVQTAPPLVEEVHSLDVAPVDQQPIPSTALVRMEGPNAPKHAANVTGA